jgi:RHH-type proline utilization regulon transcriptional repressor/proline dehydrogenase/delta 1-pyrroline-5-carboxylate dehydrogenase
VVAATVRAIQLLGRQFVYARTISDAMDEAKRPAQAPLEHAAPGLRFSYDMLGEGARTEAAMPSYLAAYQRAIAVIAAAPPSPAPGREAATSISIKLSRAVLRATKTRQRERVFAELLPRVWTLVEAAAAANINLAIDAEESERLELSLDLHGGSWPRAWRSTFRSGAASAWRCRPTRPAAWNWWTRWRPSRARRHGGLRFMVRLVKGAYWDGEVKRAQEGGLPGYPVFTHKQPHRHLLPRLRAGADRPCTT